MADALHEGHQGRQSRAEQPRLLDRFRQRGAMQLAGSAGTSRPTPWCSVTIVGAAVISTCCRTSAGRSKRPKLAAAIGTTIERVGNHLVDGLGRKVGSQVLLMAGLPAPLAILAVLSRRLGRFDQIAGGRLGRVRGVLFRLRQFRLQRGNPFQQRCGGLGHRRLNHRVNFLAREDSCHASLITELLQSSNISFSPRERIPINFLACRE